MVASLAIHGLLLVLLLIAPVKPIKEAEPAPIMVSLIPGVPALAPEPSPTPTPGPPEPTQAKAQPKPAKAAKHAEAKAVAKSTPAKPTPAKPTPVKPIARQVLMAKAVNSPTAAQRAAARAAEEDAPIATSDPVLSESQLAGATSAEGGGSLGGGGGQCDMASRLQAVLRSDPRVHAAIRGFSGKALMVWDGEWAWMRGDIGQGLTAVRQAMVWEIAYAPEACRGKPMHGLVVFHVDGPAGPVRLAVGGGDWRWTDMLGLRHVSRY